MVCLEFMLPLPQIVQSLIDYGKSPQTAACVISHGTLLSQETVTGKLENLSQLVTRARLTAPSLIVIGDCVSLRDRLQWFEQRPLFGKRIAITRPLPQGYETAELAGRYGAVPVMMPTIEIAAPESWNAVDAAIDNLADWNWLIFTSRNGVTYFLDRLLDLLNLNILGPRPQKVRRESDRHSHQDTDDQSVRKAEDHKSQTNEDTVNECHENLSSEEGDKVSIYFLECIDHFSFKF